MNPKYAEIPDNFFLVAKAGKSLSKAIKDKCAPGEMKNSFSRKLKDGTTRECVKYHKTKEAIKDAETGEVTYTETQDTQDYLDLVTTEIAAGNAELKTGEWIKKNMEVEVI